MAVCWDCGGPRSESSRQMCKRCYARKVSRDTDRRMQQFRRHSSDQLYDWAEKITLGYFEHGLRSHPKLAAHAGSPLVFVNAFFTNMRACGYFNVEYGLMVTDEMMGNGGDANIYCTLYLMCGAGLIVRNAEDDTYTSSETQPGHSAAQPKPTQPIGG